MDVLQVNCNYTHESDCKLFIFYIQEKEKETKRLPLVSSTPWSSLLITLSRLALAEKMYFSLPFIAKKFFRKDVNMPMYYWDKMGIMLDSEVLVCVQSLTQFALTVPLSTQAHNINRHLCFAAVPERLKWQKTGIMIDGTNKRNWNLRNLLVI